MTLGAVLGLAGCGTEDPDAGSEGIRHVVLISVDTLRADHLACYGHPFVQTPTVDRLASEGIRFDQVISAASSTLVSHTSLFTGNYPHRHGVVRNGFRVPDANVTLTEILGQQGFQTAGFIGAAPLATDVNFHQGFDHYDEDFTQTRSTIPHPYERTGEQVTDAVLDWLDVESTSPADRLFLFVHYFDVHTPLVAPEPYARMYDDVPTSEAALASLEAVSRRLEEDGPPPETCLQTKQRGFLKRLGRHAPLAARDALSYETQYCAEITYFDSQLGRLLEGLEERGILQDALVVLTADHGETMHEHLTASFSHGLAVFDTEIRIPLILRFPDHRQAGRVVDRLTSSVDVLPSLLSLLDLPPRAELDGRDFTPVLHGSMEERGPVFSEATKPYLDETAGTVAWPNTEKFQCIRTDRFKFMVRALDDQVRLYDLEQDPLEQQNLVETSRGDAMARKLRSALDAWRATASPEPSAAVESPEMIEALKALGYLGDEDADGH